MKTNVLFRVVSLLGLVSSALTAQIARERDVAPLKNWAAPLYWQPSEAERQAAATGRPELQFPAAVSTDALIFVAVTPCRILDTRKAFGGNGPIGPGNFPNGLLLQVQGSSPCLIPSIAQAYSFNVTAVQPASFDTGYITVFPWPTKALVATLVWTTALPYLSNAAIVPAGTGGAVGVYASDTQEVVIDINGYFSAPTDLNSNTALGFQSLFSTTPSSTSTHDVAVGGRAGYSNTTGSFNTFLGDAAGYYNQTGSWNTFAGAGAGGGTSGDSNSMFGYNAGYNNTGSNNSFFGRSIGFFNTGSNNTFAGMLAGYNNTADNNSFFGYKAGTANSSGFQNTFIGYQAGTSNTSADGSTTFGQENTFVGYNSGLSSKTSQGNTFVGSNSGMLSGGVNPNDCCNTYVGKNSGLNAATSNNTFVGYRTGETNTNGHDNVYVGLRAGVNTNGSLNVFVGTIAGETTTAGDANTFIGPLAGHAVNGGSGNIEIGNVGTAADTHTIRIGTGGTGHLEGDQTKVFIEPILSNVAGGDAVTINTSTGQLGHMASSRRFKEQILDVGDRSSRIFQLRPVSFFYKPEYDDGSHALQYGLIAEEVAKVYPEMVTYDKDGTPFTVRYQLLAPMLLNEVQKQNLQIQKQAETLQLQQDQNQKLEARLAALEALLSGKASGVASQQ